MSFDRFIYDMKIGDKYYSVKIKNRHDLPEYYVRENKVLDSNYLNNKQYIKLYKPPISWVEFRYEDGYTQEFLISRNRVIWIANIYHHGLYVEVKVGLNTKKTAFWKDSPKYYNGVYVKDISEEITEGIPKLEILSNIAVDINLTPVRYGAVPIFIFPSIFNLALSAEGSFIDTEEKYIIYAHKFDVYKIHRSDFRRMLEIINVDKNIEDYTKYYIDDFKLSRIVA